MAQEDGYWQQVYYALDWVMDAISDRQPQVVEKVTFGAVDIDPKYLAIHFLFATDREREFAQETGLSTEIAHLTREKLNQVGYPPESLREIYIGFTSQEEIQTQAGGDYRLYFQ
ncbi:hypothetical protein HC928_08610 [bacterium]|nr:hypothetical protein [bacterium]